MKVEAHKGKREVQITCSAEEVAAITGHGTVENMMKKYPARGMEDALKQTFGGRGFPISYQRRP